MVALGDGNNYYNSVCLSLQAMPGVMEMCRTKRQSFILELFRAYVQKVRFLNFCVYIVISLFETNFLKVHDYTFSSI